MIPVIIDLIAESSSCAIEDFGARFDVAAGVDLGLSSALSESYKEAFADLVIEV